nr:putative axial regulator YABBY 2 isoform X2 [Ipomoea batatas]
MSLDITTASADRVCYVNCSFCNTILAVSVPCISSMLNTVVVRCGHCSNLLSVDLGALLHPFPLQDFQQQEQHQFEDAMGSVPSNYNCNMFSVFESHDQLLEQSIISFYAALEKRQRAPSAYNRFIKEEIHRIKASNPKISHKEAFSAAAKNWAHFPHAHFGLNLVGNRQANVDDAVGDQDATQ